VKNGWKKGKISLRTKIGILEAPVVNRDATLLKRRHSERWRRVY